jgi:hypothetical protein
VSRNCICLLSTCCRPPGNCFLVSSISPGVSPVFFDSSRLTSTSQMIVTQPVRGASTDNCNEVCICSMLSQVICYSIYGSKKRIANLSLVNVAILGQHDTIMQLSVVYDDTRLKVFRSGCIYILTSDGGRGGFFCQCHIK